MPEKMQSDQIHTTLSARTHILLGYLCARALNQFGDKLESDEDIPKSEQLDIAYAVQLIANAGMELSKATRAGRHLDEVHESVQQVLHEQFYEKEHPEKKPSNFFDERDMLRALEAIRLTPDETFKQPQRYSAVVELHEEMLVALGTLGATASKFLQHRNSNDPAIYAEQVEQMEDLSYYAANIVGHLISDLPAAFHHHIVSSGEALAEKPRDYRFRACLRHGFHLKWDNYKMLPKGNVPPQPEPTDKNFVDMIKEHLEAAGIEVAVHTINAEDLK